MDKFTLKNKQFRNNFQYFSAVLLLRSEVILQVQHWEIL